MTSLTPIILSTERLTLRFLSEADLPAVYDIFSHPEVMRYWSYPPWTDRSQAQQWLINVQEGYRTRNALQLGIERRADVSSWERAPFFNSMSPVAGPRLAMHWADPIGDQDTCTKPCRRSCALRLPNPGSQSP